MRQQLSISFEEKAEQLLHFIDPSALWHVGSKFGEIDLKVALEIAPLWLVSKSCKMGADLMKDEGIDDAPSADHESVAAGALLTC